MPINSAQCLFTDTVSLRRSDRKSGKLFLPLINSDEPLSLLLPFIKLLSIIPVRDTPSSASSSVLCTHLGRKRLKLVNDDWNVPSIVANLTFRIISF